MLSDQFKADCLHWRGRVLTGAHAHWCDDYDGLPVDETTPEWPCSCYKELPMRFVIEQIALKPAGRDVTRAMDLLRAIGLTEWVYDVVIAEGEVRNTPFRENRACLRFNYQASPLPQQGATAGATMPKPLELEVINYEAGDNFLETTGASAVVSHLAMHVSAEELVQWRAKFKEYGIKPIQDVVTKSHTNPAIAGKRWYNYVIFGTRDIIGCDLKFIVRREKPDV